MDWKKRECPVKMEINPYGAGWEDITLDIGGDHHWWSVSGCLGDGLGALVESLYALYPNQMHDDPVRRWLSEIEECVGDFRDGAYTNLRPKTEDDHTYIELPKCAKFYWDEEGQGVHWKLTRESGTATDFMLVVELTTVGYGTDSKTYRYDVRYSDLCYAVGKALTEALKKHGFAGFHVSVWESDVNVRHLCFLKACGMGHPEAVKPVDSGREDTGDISSFMEELELLAFDM